MRHFVYKPWSTSSHARRQLPNLPQHIRRGRCTGSQQVLCVTAVCRAGYNQLRQLRLVVLSLSVQCTCQQDSCPGVHLLSSGLLQLTVVQHQRRASSPPTIVARRCDHISPITALSTSSSTSRFQCPGAHASDISWSCAGESC